YTGERGGPAHAAEPRSASVGARHLPVLDRRAAVVHWGRTCGAPGWRRSQCDRDGVRAAWLLPHSGVALALALCAARRAGAYSGWARPVGRGAPAPGQAGALAASATPPHRAGAWNASEGVRAKERAFSPMLSQAHAHHSVADRRTLDMPASLMVLVLGLLCFLSGASDLLRLRLNHTWNRTVLVPRTCAVVLARGRAVAAAVLCGVGLAYVAAWVLWHAQYDAQRLSPLDAACILPVLCGMVAVLALLVLWQVRDL